MCEHNEKDVNEVIPNLWLGNVNAAYNKKFIDKYNIKYILTVMDDFDIKYKYDDVTYLVVPIKDKKVCDIDMHNIFATSIYFINNALKNNSPILVHCKRGHHRSAAIVAGFLVQHLRIGYEAATKYIHHLRPCALRRDTCMTRHLFQYCLNIK